MFKSDLDILKNDILKRHIRREWVKKLDRKNYEKISRCVIRMFTINSVAQTTTFLPLKQIYAHSSNGSRLDYDIKFWIWCFHVKSSYFIPIFKLTVVKIFFLIIREKKVDHCKSQKDSF